eukprot:9613973-Lingulodinium_polyedra.AAC.1
MTTRTPRSTCARSAGTPWTMRARASPSTSGRDAGIFCTELASRPCAGVRSNFGAPSGDSMRVESPRCSAAFTGSTGGA